MSKSLSTAQKMFNQRLLAEHCMAHKDALQLWDTIRQDDDIDLDDSLIEANQQLKYVGLEIVGIRSQEGVLHLCMIQPAADNVTKGIGQYPIHQHNYTRLVLEHLVEHGDTKLTELKNLRLKEGNLDLPKAEDVLHDLLDQKWILDCGSNKVNLAPRAFAELSSLFTQEFGMEKEELPQQIFYR